MNHDKMLAVLQEFYKNLQAVLDNPVTTHRPTWFKPTAGICSNLLYYLKHSSFDSVDSLRINTIHIQYLRHCFPPARILINVIPFNRSHDHYLTECTAQTIWQNPARLDFVRKHSQASNWETVKWLD